MVCPPVWAVYQGVKGGAWALHPDAIWIECVKGIPKSFSSVLLFTNTGANQPTRQGPWQEEQ